MHDKYILCFSPSAVAANEFRSYNAIYLNLPLPFGCHRNPFLYFFNFILQSHVISIGDEVEFTIETVSLLYEFLIWIF